MPRSQEFANEARWGVDDEADADQAIERYFTLLKPTADEHDALRNDRGSAIGEGAKTVCGFPGIHPTSARPRQAVDPWENRA